MKIGFDNAKYLKIQSEHIKERIGHFGNKLYLEFGGKIFDDLHASRVLPGFEPDSKMRMLMQLSDIAEVIMVITRKSDLNFLLRTVKGIDPNAFLSVTSVTGVYGKGFESIKAKK